MNEEEVELAKQWWQPKDGRTECSQDNEKNVDKQYVTWNYWWSSSSSPAQLRESINFSMANFRNIENINLFPSKAQPGNFLSRRRATRVKVRERGHSAKANRKEKISSKERKPSKRCRRRWSFETDRLLLRPRFHRRFCNIAGWPAFVYLFYYCCCSERSSPSFRCYSQFFTFLNINWTLFLKFVESTLSRSGRRVFGP